MIRTTFYEPADPEKFRKNLRRRHLQYSDRFAHFNSAQSMDERGNGELIYHVLDTTVFVRYPSEKRMVGITANVKRTSHDEISEAKSLLEEISRVKLIEAI